MAIKIAITGAQGVGKTTLAKQLQETTGHALLPEAARILIAKGHKMDKHVSIATEMELLSCQKELELTKGSWIADRCFVDLLAYTIVLFPNHTNMHDQIREELAKAEYDVILYIPPEFTIEDDGVRSTDSKFRYAIDRNIRKILRKSSYEHYEITGNPSLRLRKAVEIIGKVVQ